MKRLVAAMLLLALLVGATPALAAKKNTQMRDGVPVWTEQTVRDYAIAYVKGKVMNTLYGYYDLQIRRYVPMTTYESMLTELEWMTGAFQALGSYRTFDTPADQTRTHVLHLCMERTDLDMYFTHKAKEDDWEVMALEFVPAAEEPLPDGSDMLVDGADAAAPSEFDEVSVTLGRASQAVGGTLTIPAEANAQNPVPGCVFVHDWGALDRDETIGDTRFFEELAHALARMGVASVRYDKRTYVYPVTESMMVGDEVVGNAIDAAELLLGEPFIDPKRVVVVGHGFGAMVAPLVAQRAEELFTAIVMIGGSPRPFLDQILASGTPDITRLSDAERQALVETAAAFPTLSKSKASALTVLGRGGAYFFELNKLDQVKQIKKLKLPTYILQGDADPCVSEDDGWRAYAEAIGDGATYMSFKSFRGLDHYLAQPGGTALDAQAGRNIAQWILNLLMDAE